VLDTEEEIAAHKTALGASRIEHDEAHSCRRNTTDPVSIIRPVLPTSVAKAGASSAPDGAQNLVSLICKMAELLDESIKAAAVPGSSSNAAALLLTADFKKSVEAAAKQTAAGAVAKITEKSAIVSVTSGAAAARGVDDQMLVEDIADDVAAQPVLQPVAVPQVLAQLPVPPPLETSKGKIAAKPSTAARIAPYDAAADESAGGTGSSADPQSAGTRDVPPEESTESPEELAAVKQRV
jgi:hypothetical protein